MDAITTSATLSATYRRYLRSLLPVREKALSAALAECIAASPMLTKGPLLEATPPYRSGFTLRELIGEGVLDQEFARLGSPALPLDRPLHAHQEQASGDSNESQRDLTRPHLPIVGRWGHHYGDGHCHQSDRWMETLLRPSQLRHCASSRRTVEPSRVHAQ